jgi:hypothetical protein
MAIPVNSDGLGILTGGSGGATLPTLVSQREGEVLRASERLRRPPTFSVVPTGHPLVAAAKVSIIST